MARAAQPDLFADLPAPAPALSTASAADPARTATPGAAATETAAPAAVVREPNPYGDLPPVPPGGHTPDTIRAFMHEILASARAADVMPWTERMQHVYTVWFPHLAAWVPPEEGKRLLAEFHTEFARLTRPR